MPFWFYKKIFLFSLGLAGVLSISILLIKNNQHLSGFLLFISGLLLFIYGKHNFNSRKYGFLVEKKAYLFLKNRFPQYTIEFRKKLDYGDIDIFIKEKKLAIDVKAYKKIDKRIFSEKNLKSYKKQKMKSEDFVIWLPECKEEAIKNLNGFTVICGYNSIVSYLKRGKIINFFPKKKNRIMPFFKTFMLKLS